MSPDIPDILFSWCSFTLPCEEPVLCFVSYRLSEEEDNREEGSDGERVNGSKVGGILTEEFTSSVSIYEIQDKRPFGYSSVRGRF